MCKIVKETPKIVPVTLGDYEAFCVSTGCPSRYRTWHFFNNSNTNEDIATKFKQYVLFFHISYTMK